MEKENKIININQQALTAFITSIIGFAFMSSIVLCVPGLVLGIISMAFNKRGIDAKGRPYHFFIKFSRPVSIVTIVLSAVMIFAISVTLTVLGIIAISQNAINK